MIDIDGSLEGHVAVAAMLVSSHTTIPILISIPIVIVQIDRFQIEWHDMHE
jgi:hypothetical protein